MCVGYVNTVVCLHDTTVAEQTQQFHANTKVLVGNAIQWHHGVTRAPPFVQCGLGGSSVVFIAGISISKNSRESSFSPPPLFLFLSLFSFSLSASNLIWIHLLVQFVTIVNKLMTTAMHGQSIQMSSKTEFALHMQKLDNNLCWSVIYVYKQQTVLKPQKCWSHWFEWIKMDTH